MKKLLVYLVLAGLLVGFTPSALAASNRHDRGAVVVDTKGTVYFIGENTRYPFPSMEVFTSWGHKPSDIKKAMSGDLALAIGPIAQLNLPIVGHVDEITSDGIIRGWVMDKANLQDMPTIWVYYDIPYASEVSNYHVQAHGVIGDNRPDVNLAHGVSGDFGFEITVADQFRDGVQHTAYVYAVRGDEKAEGLVLLAGSPIQFTVSEDAVSASGLELLTPNGGEEWILDDTKIIDWEDDGFISGTHTYNLYLVDPNKTTFYLIESGITSTYYNWSVGSVKQNDLMFPVAEGYRIQVVRQGDLLGLYDQSNSTFDIVDNGFAPSTPEEMDTLTFITNVYVLESLYDYYIENNSYPQTLTEIDSELASVSVSPYGVCSGNASEWAYVPASDLKSYSFKFCLGTDYIYNQLAADSDGAVIKDYFKKGQNTWSYQDVTAIVEFFIELTEQDSVSSNNFGSNGSGKVAGINIIAP